jgi:hypothetical protein
MVKLYKEELESAWNKYNKQYDKVISAIEDEAELQNIEQHYITTEKTYINGHVMYDTFLEEASRPITAEHQAELSGNDLSTYLQQHKLIMEKMNALTVNSRPAQVQSAIKLPKITLKPFFGSYEEWPSFYDLFKHSVVGNTSLSDAEKLQYLKGMVQGHAEELIRNITISDANFAVAWNLLQTRYECKSAIIQTQITRIMTLPDVDSVTSHGIRELSDKADGILRALEALGNYASSRDVILIHILLKKVDQPIREAWAMTTKRNNLEEPKVNDFMKFLQTQAEVLEMSSTSN